jgi:hypothetical protein
MIYENDVYGEWLAYDYDYEYEYDHDCACVYVSDYVMIMVGY